MFVTSRDVACLLGGSFLGTILALSERIVCEWLPVIACPKLFLLPSHAFDVASPSLPFSLSLSNPCHLFVLFSALCYFLRLCILPEKNDTRVSRLVVSLICLLYFCGYFFFFFRILKAAFDLKPTTVGLHESPAKPGWCFHLWDTQPKGPRGVLMISASTGLLAAWEDDIFHQSFIFTAFSSLGYTVRWVRWTDQFYKTDLDLH